MRTRTFIVSLLALVLMSCEVSEPKEFAFTVEGIKSLHRNIVSVNLTPQANNTDSYISEIVIKKDPVMSGASDWNWIARNVFEISASLFARPEPAKITYIIRSPKSNNVDWAKVVIDRNNLPANWQKLTYLQFFGYCDATPGNALSGEWLKQFRDNWLRSIKPTVDAK